MFNSTPQNILVRMPNWLGDCVMATPVLAQLKRHFPNAHLTAMCQHNVAPLLAHDPHIDAIFSFRKPSGWVHRQQHRAIIAPLQQEHFDVGFLLTNSFSSAWWLWRGRIPRRIGWRGNLRSCLLTDALTLPVKTEQQHQVLTYQELLAPLGISVSDESPRLYLTEGELDAARALLIKCGWQPQKQRLIGINPGAAYGTAKCWLPERFQTLTERLLEDEKNFVVYFGDAGTASLVHSICQHFTGNILNLAAKTDLRELMALIAVCDVFLTNDSGPMHIAAALQTPLVALFGSTSAIKTGPYGQGPCRIIHKHVSCSPCYRRVCPIDLRCMQRIEVDEVYRALQELQR
jgi:heptosyltransferase-2